MHERGRRRRQTGHSVGETPGASHYRLTGFISGYSNLVLNAVRLRIFFKFKKNNKKPTNKQKTRETATQNQLLTLQLIIYQNSIIMYQNSLENGNGQTWVKKRYFLMISIN